MPVTLQPCGVTVGTVWIFDTADANGGYMPFISGQDTQYPAPYVLTANTAGDSLIIQALKGEYRRGRRSSAVEGGPGDPHRKLLLQRLHR